MSLSLVHALCPGSWFNANLCDLDSKRAAKHVCSDKSNGLVHVCVYVRVRTCMHVRMCMYVYVCAYVKEQLL